MARKYEQTLRAESAEATRRRILDALEERLREAPTEPVTMEQIARRAGVARTTVYLVFDSRAGLFDALATDLWIRDALEHLRGGLRAGVAIYAALRDVAVALFSMSALDPDSVGGAIERLEARRWGGMEYLAGRLGEQNRLRADVTVEEAADVLWMLASFGAFDALYTGRGMSADDVSRTLIAAAERTLCA
jgi:AcrR family transcriptional regulator